MIPRGIIIGGGEASRLGGGEKPLLMIEGVTLIERLIARVAPQTATLALNIRESSKPHYATLAARGIDLLTDEFAGDVGPLGGVLAGLDWAAAAGDADWLATFPADTPFLPRDLVARLMAKAETGKPVVTRAEGRLQPLCAIWPLSCRDALRLGLEKGDYRGVGWTLHTFGAIECDFADGRSFFNINTQEDHATARQLASALDGDP